MMISVSFVSVLVLLFAGSVHAVADPRDRNLREMSCGTCKEVIQVLVDVIRDPSALNISKDVLLAVCNSTYSTNPLDKDMCDGLVDVVIDVLPMILNGLDHLAWDVPLTICSDVVKVCSQPCCLTPHSPEQIFINYAQSNDLSQMRVTWITLNETIGSVVSWNTSAGVRGSAPDATRTYLAGGWVGVIHSAVMNNLQPGTQVTYTVGCDAFGWSAPVTFFTLPTNIGSAGRPLRLAQVADMAYDNNSDNTVMQLTQLALSGQIDLLLHPGDISYADGDEQHWDLYFRKIQPIVSRVPYMTAPGNHEFWWNFTAYWARLGLSMPPAGSGVAERSMFYSLVVGPVFFVFLNSETWVDTPDIDEPQVAWLKNRLISKFNRTQTPWLLGLHHRPLYCGGGGGCGDEAKFLRSQVEGVYLGFRFDMIFNGHMHFYERSFPVANGSMVTNSYVNPPAPVYVVNGAAGNREGQSGVRPEAYIAQESRDIGFVVLNISTTSKGSSCTAQFRESINNQIVDSIIITKN